MDWATFDHQPRPRSDGARLELLETAWRLVGLTGKVITCGLYRTDVGVELRAHYGDDDLIRSTRVLTRDEATTVAEAWKAAAVAKGFTELPLA